MEYKRQFETEGFQKDYWLRVGAIIGRQLVGFSTYESGLFDGALHIPGDIANRIVELQEAYDALLVRVKEGTK